ncbi:MAG: EamA family transporter [Chloroflexota bacterium]|nr:EamA family transporter [Chloroflexota bacterium]
MVVSERVGWADWAVFAALGLMWGSSFLFIKIGVETLTPFTLVAGRIAIGAAVLLAIVLTTREVLPRQRRVYAHIAVVAMLGMVIPFSLITWGERTIDSALAAILNATVPLFVIVLAAIALRDEPITVNRLVGLVLGFAGVVLLMSPDLAAGSRADVGGQLALIGSSVSYAAGNVYARRFVRNVRPLSIAFLELSFALVAALALVLIFERPFDLPVDGTSLVAVGWLGVFGSGLAFVAFFRLLSRWGSTRSSLVAYVLPVVGIVLGAVFLHENVGPVVLAGTGLVIGGIALTNARFGQRRLIGRAPLPPPADGADRPVAPGTPGTGANVSRVGD